MNQYFIIPLLTLVLCFTTPNFSFAADNIGSQPALIKAKSLHHDQETGIITASDNVEITQGNRILVADKVTYNQNTDTIHATGNISILEPNGDVYFAHEVTLNNEMKEGFIKAIQARFRDGTLLAATSGERLDETTYALNEAVYSPCPVCSDDGEKGEPLWQLKAKKVKLDEEKQRIIYKHGFFEVYGTPIFYTPYFSHATPDADKKSGFLTPKYGSDSTLGTMVEMPYYINIAPNMDATLTPIMTSEEGEILSGEYRHLIDNGRYRLYGSITRPSKVDEFGNPIEGHELRGHIEGYGDFTLDHDWRWGFAAKRSTDDTYLRRYQFGNEDDLTSKLYAERIAGRSYTSIETLSFQGLQASDDPGKTPLILPIVQHHMEKNTGYRGSRWILDANSMVLLRDEGADSRRVSVKGGWTLPHITPSGHVFKLTTSLRGDVYSVNNVTDPFNPNGEDLDGIQTRALPQVEVDWSFPLVQQHNRSRIFLEPVANLIISPYGGNPDEIPNEDSQDLELSDDNLFTSNRFTGLDRIESGPRVNYGIRGGIDTSKNTHIGGLLGQNYRVKEDRNFTSRSGMDDNFSDYVGRITLSTHDIFDLAYRFRIDREEFVANRNEIDSTIDLHPISFGMNYLSLDEDFIGNNGKREEISATTALALNDKWTLSGHARRDLTSNGGLIYSGANLLYAGDCVDFTFSMYREFTRDRDIEPSTSFTFQVTLRNLN